MKYVLVNSTQKSVQLLSATINSITIHTKFQSFQLTHKMSIIQSRLLYARCYTTTRPIPPKRGRPELPKGHHDMFLSKTGRILRATANKLSLGIFSRPTNRHPDPLSLAMCRNMYQFGRGALLPRFPESALTDLGGGSLYQSITMSRRS